MKTHELQIAGMTCGHCVMSVKKELGKLDDVTVLDVQIGKAKVQIDESKVNPERLTKAVEGAGYRVVSVN